MTGIRGAYANVWHTVVRLAFDQTVENATGVGAPPKTWPAQEKVVDIGHKDGLLPGHGRGYRPVDHCGPGDPPRHHQPLSPRTRDHRFFEAHVTVPW
ncbi:hypothetical protein ACT4S5_18370 [Kocuria oceani]